VAIVIWAASRPGTTRAGARRPSGVFPAVGIWGAILKKRSKKALSRMPESGKMVFKEDIEGLSPGSEILCWFNLAGFL